MSLHASFLKHLALLPVMVTGFLPCGAIELLISDSGRNESWSPQLKAGDSFEAKGGDGTPVGGIFNLSSTIGQFLLPMPDDLELAKMTKAQEDNLAREWGELVSDRVHIAVMNREPNFEIRLLQHTPRPRAAGDSWAENPNADRFARIAYASVAKTVDYLTESDTPVKITAALADSGAAAFVRAIDGWRSYAASFRRADLVQARAGLKETRTVIATLGAGRVRTFINLAGKPTPLMTVGRREIAEALLAESHGLMVFFVRPAIANPTAPGDARADADWMDILTGSTPLTIESVVGGAPGTVGSAGAALKESPPEGSK